ncbi:MAG: Ku protein [Acidimicrobiales bacterium]
MARPIWTGSLGFGLVSVPVGLYAATEDHAVHFHQLEAGTSDRIRYRRVNERTGEEVPRERIARGVDLGTGEHVVLDDGELEAIAPERSRTIEIVDFVDLLEIDPVYFETTYYLAPRGDAAGRAYALLRAAMAQTAKVGIALFVLRGRERVVAVRPDRAVLALETMYFADEVRNPARELPELPGDVEFTERELSTADMLIESLTTEWEPGRYRSSYREALTELIERKRHGETVHAATATERVAPIVDLMDALNASLDASHRDGGRAAAGGNGGKSSRQGKRRGGKRTAAGEDGEAPAGDLSTMTKAALLSRAAQLDIAGRSKMHRDELEVAVRRSTRRKAS